MKKKRNEFWKYRHNPNNKKEKIIEIPEEFVQTYIPPKINFQSEEEFLKISI